MTIFGDRNQTLAWYTVAPNVFGHFRTKTLKP